MSPRRKLADDDMRPEYDFTGGVRGKYFQRYSQGTNVVLLDPDVAAVFTNPVAVNEALRALLAVAEARVPRAKPATASLVLSPKSRRNPTAVAGNLQRSAWRARCAAEREASAGFGQRGSLMNSKWCFVLAPKPDWCLSAPVGSEQRSRLLGGVPYEEIVARLVEEAELVAHSRQRVRQRHQYFRATITISVRASTADLFHNSVGGYRAQYYDCVERGLRANSYALEQIVPRIVELLDGRQKRTCPFDWFQKSLLDSDAKVWIHQGAWWRQAKIADRLLRVARWPKEESSPDKRRRQRAKWATLIPDQERRIDVKGGFLSLSGVSLGSLKPDRALNIHQLGFT